METSQTGQGDGLDENVIEGEVPTLARATCAFGTKGARHVSTIQHKVSSTQRTAGFNEIQEWTSSLILPHRIHVCHIDGSTFTINILPMLAYIPYMDPSWVLFIVKPMGHWGCSEHDKQGVLIRIGVEDPIQWYSFQTRTPDNTWDPNIFQQFRKISGVLTYIQCGGP